MEPLDTEKYPVPIYYTDENGSDVTTGGNRRVQAEPFSTRAADTEYNIRPTRGVRGGRDQRRGRGSRSGRGRGQERPMASRARGGTRGLGRADSGADRGKFRRGGRLNENGTCLYTRQTDRNQKQSYSHEDTKSEDMDEKLHGCNDHDEKRPQRVYKMGYKKLEELSKMTDPDKLLIIIGNSRSGFTKCLQDDQTPDCIHLILGVLSVAVKTEACVTTLRDFLHTVEDNLHKKLNDFLLQIILQNRTHARIFDDLEKLQTVCCHISDVLKAELGVLPSSLSKCYNVILLLNQVKNMYFQHDDLMQTNIHELEKLRDAVQKERDDLQARMNRKSISKSQRLDDDKQPPENFRQLQILPTERDLQWDEKPFLRANKAKGKYDSLDTYLDIQFRLLREDYIQPLRHGIKQYKEGILQGSVGKKIKDIRLYLNVQILNPVCTSAGICNVLQFDTIPFQKTNWAASRRLLYGSLVCLSADDFDTLFFGIITERKLKDLEQGQVQVLFQTNYEIKIKTNVTYTMAETTAYFEAYKYILEGLQETKDSMPLQRYIIRCENVIKPLGYLLGRGVATYDLSPILTTEASMKKQPTTYPVLNTNRWPDEDDVIFDTSQLDALKMALTKELALIQGPPGTGKTYVGLKIAEILLANGDYWNLSGKAGNPVLVVCYTNHALDQFLGGIHAFCKDGIVRVGGRSDNEELEPFFLKNLKREQLEQRKRSNAVHQGERECRKVLWETRSKIEQVSTQIKACATKCLPMLEKKCMGRIMTPYQYESFGYSNLNQNVLAVWLGLSSIDQGEESWLPETLKLSMMWKDFILNDVQPMCKDVAVLNTDIDKLDLYRKAQLYKAWILDYISLLQFSCKNTVLQQIKTKKSQTEILSLRELRTEITDSHFKKQMDQLEDKQKPIDKWLCLNHQDWTDEKRALIKQIITDTPAKNAEKEFGDVEENRELEELDDLGLFADYKTKAFNQRNEEKTKTDEEWFTVYKEKKRQKQLLDILKRPPKLTEEVLTVDNVWSLNMEQRKDLYRHWVNKYRELLREQVEMSEREYMTTIEKYKEIIDHESFEILEQAKVIGMTTTGAAKNRKILQKVKPRIIIVEEAAEVLESHIITTLNQDCQHLILIGDHKQLRPNPTVYELAKKYNLDISLFERLVRNEVPCVTLEEQHRMRPEISKLMKHKDLYPNLRDHSSVQTYGNVLGIDGNICFIDHKQDEELIGDSTSYTNTHEARYLASLCKYLLKQGYTPDQITVLSPYMGQVFKLRKEMPKDEFEGVRITAVDNFQGEENEIILLSLVRSRTEEALEGKKNPIGFLATENRVCVALSRAKQGLFVTGNFSLFAKYSEMWKRMVDCLSRTNCVKSSLTLRCQNHSNSVIEAKTADDFKAAPDGGCKLTCDKRLKCGHVCQRFCHVVDKDHEMIKCYKPCPRTNKCGHECQRKCYEDCSPCQKLIEKRIPMCGHMVILQCSVDPVTCKCKARCSFRLPCGHQCMEECGRCLLKKKHAEECQAEVEKRMPCNHIVKMRCFENPELRSCSHPCSIELSCGHQCTGSCGMCLAGKIHKPCINRCGKILPCGHRCQFPCSDLCPPCSIKCTWKCSHGIRCQNKCSEKCMPCTEICFVKCGHQNCERKCFEECKNFKCDKDCPEQLKPCNHPCAGLCGEKCPSVCRLCQPEFFAKLPNPSDKVVALRDCGCIISVSEMDHHMQEHVPASARDVSVFRCPLCRKPIYEAANRYINLMKGKREMIVEKFKKLTGTLEERQKETLALKRAVDALKDLGLTDIESSRLKKALETESFGILHLVRKTCDALRDLLKLILEAEDEKASGNKNAKRILEEAFKIREVLMSKRKYATSQFWTEVKIATQLLKPGLAHTQSVQN